MSTEKHRSNYESYESSHYMQGLLESQTSLFKTSTCWCILKNGKMSFYKQNGEMNSPPQAYVDVSKIQSVRRSARGFSFEITCNSKTKVFSAETADLRDKWIQRLMEAMNSVNRPISMISSPGWHYFDDGEQADENQSHDVGTDEHNNEERESPVTHHFRSSSPPPSSNTGLQADTPSATDVQSGQGESNYFTFEPVGESHRNEENDGGGQCHVIDADVANTNEETVQPEASRRPEISLNYQFSSSLQLVPETNVLTSIDEKSVPGPATESSDNQTRSKTAGRSVTMRHSLRRANTDETPSAENTVVELVLDVSYVPTEVADLKYPHPEFDLPPAFDEMRSFLKSDLSLLNEMDQTSVAPPRNSIRHGHAIENLKFFLSNLD